MTSFSGMKLLDGKTQWCEVPRQENLSSTRVIVDSNAFSPKSCQLMTSQSLPLVFLQCFELTRRHQSSATGLEQTLRYNRLSSKSSKFSKISFSSVSTYNTTFSIGFSSQRIVWCEATVYQDPCSIFLKLFYATKSRLTRKYNNLELAKYSVVISPNLTPKTKMSTQIFDNFST